MVKVLRGSITLAVVAYLMIISFGCEPRDYSRLPAHSRQHFLNAVIEIPAGSNMKTFYCPISHRFKIEMDEDRERRLEYLPYPANFGFIPSTRLGVEGNEGGHIDILVISERLDIGTVIETIPVGLLIIKDEFRTDYKVLALPADREKQVVRAESFFALKESYPALINIIETWFINSGLYTNPLVLGWEDEIVTRNFINKWIIDSRDRPDKEI
jgi:inorganic pyrophosphatase